VTIFTFSETRTYLIRAIFLGEMAEPGEVARGNNSIGSRERYGDNYFFLQRRTLIVTHNHTFRISMPAR
jgi:hypothetical protein